MDTDVRFMDTDSYDDIYAEMDRVGQASGKKYYKIPCGGSNAIGALGYVNCMKEIADTGMHFDYVCCAEGSGGTHAGVALGAKLFMPETQVVGMLAANECLVLDPVYTGKAFAGLGKLAREGKFKPDDNVLYLYSGGAGGLFAIDVDLG